MLLRLQKDAPEPATYFDELIIEVKMCQHTWLLRASRIQDLFDGQYCVQVSAEKWAHAISANRLLESNDSETERTSLPD